MGITIGKLILEISTAEAFDPTNFFLPLDNDPHRTPPKIEALGVNKLTFKGFEGSPDYDTIGLTRQACPVAKGWFLVRHIPTGTADPYERCWMENGNAVVIREIDYSVNPLALSEDEESVDKDRFFAAGTVATTPLKYKWSN
jgi:hypothetical protein